MKPAGFLVAIVLPLLCGCSRTDPIVDPLPPLVSVSSMTISRLMTGDREEGASYPIPQANWQAIYDALAPARADRTPANWQLLGTLKVACVDGKSFDVGLYLISEGPGAFSIGNPPDRVYYRGGDSAKLQQAIKTALH